MVSHSPFHLCCTDLHLRFGLTPFAVRPYWTYHQDNQSWTGYTPRIFDAIANEMGFSYTIVGLGDGAPDLWLDFTSYADLFWKAQHFEFTVPVVETSYRALVLRTEHRAGLFQLFDPFTPGLWLAVLGCILLFGVGLMFLHLVAPSGVPYRQRLSVDAFFRTMYHMFVAAMGGDDYEWVTWPLRVLRIAVLFFCLIILSTYTANLAAFFTRSEFKIWGPRDIAELRNARACLTEENPAIGAFVKDTVGFPGNSTEAYEEAKDWCHALLQEKKVDVWLELQATIHTYWLEHCADTNIVDSISILPTYAGIFAHKNHSLVVQKMNSVINHFKATPAYGAILRDEWGTGQRCDDRKVASVTSQVSLESMSGFFIIVGALTGLALLTALAQAAWHRASPKKKDADVEPDHASDHTMTEGEMLRKLLSMVASIQRR